MAAPDMSAQHTDELAGALVSVLRILAQAGREARLQQATGSEEQPAPKAAEAVPAGDS